MSAFAALETAVTRTIAAIGAALEERTRAVLLAELGQTDRRRIAIARALAQRLGAGATPI